MLHPIFEEGGISREYVLSMKLVPPLNQFLISQIFLLGCDLGGFVAKGCYGPKAFLYFQACCERIKNIALSICNFCSLYLFVVLRHYWDKTYYPTREAQSIILRIVHWRQNDPNYDVGAAYWALKTIRNKVSLSRAVTEVEKLLENEDKKKMVDKIIKDIGGVNPPQNRL